MNSKEKKTINSNIKANPRTKSNKYYSINA